MRNRNYVRWLSLAAVLLSGGLLMYAQRGVAPGRGPALALHHSDQRDRNRTQLRGQQSWEQGRVMP